MEEDSSSLDPIRTFSFESTSPTFSSTTDVPEEVTQAPRASRQRSLSMDDRSVTSPTPQPTTKQAMASAFAKFRTSSDTLMKKAQSFRSVRTGHSFTSPFSKPRWDPQGRVLSASASFEFHGEDAMAMGSYFHIVADGVSAPMARSKQKDQSKGVTSAIIARALVKHVEEALNDVTENHRMAISAQTFESAIVQGIKAARIECFEHRKSRIASTLSVTYFDRWHSKLLAFTLGDSKCILLRKGELVFETSSCVREFNVPCIVGLSKQVSRKDYVVQHCALQPGDVVMTFSDGIADNIYEDELLSILSPLKGKGETSQDELQSVCDALADKCKCHEKKDGDTDELFPFATAAVNEYANRALYEVSSMQTDVLSKESNHLSYSSVLARKHEGKKTLSKELRRNRKNYKLHYTLSQLRKMAELSTNKPDDISLCMTKLV